MQQTGTKTAISEVKRRTTAIETLSCLRATAEILVSVFWPDLRRYQNTEFTAFIDIFNDAFRIFNTTLS